MIIVISTGEALSAGGDFGTGGWTPVLGLVADGNRIVQQVVDFTGGSGIKPDIGLYVGASGFVPLIADAVNVRGATGAGTAGLNAWTAVEALAVDGERRVKQVIDWVGGSGDKPATGMYVGPAGYVALASQATDVRGAPGGGGNVVIRPAGNSLVLDVDSIYQPLTVTGSVALIVSGSSFGIESSMTVIANGVNVPTITGADEWSSSFGYLNTNGTPNLLSVWHDGLARRFAWSQQAVPAPVDILAPTFSGAAINGASLTLSYNESLNTTAPAASAFSVVGAGGVTQTPTNVNIAGSAVTLTLATPAVSGNTVTLSYTPPGSNPIRDTAGNAAVALSNQAVTNNTGAESAAILELTSLVKLSQGTGGTDDVYTADASAVTSFGASGRSTLTLSGDGWLSVDWPSASNGAVIVGFDAFNNANWAGANYPDYYMQLSTSANTVFQGSNSSTSTTIGTTLTPSATARYRLRRVGTTVSIEESNDSGATWTNRYTFPGSSTGTLYVSLHTLQANVIYRPRQVGLA